MKVRNLDTFYWVASLGSFRAASDKLNLTQPAITARIQVLEQDLGTRVFAKDLKRAKLTALGRKLFGFAEQFMLLEEQLISAFSETALINQVIRLGASETIASTWLPDFLGTLSKTRGNLSFELIVASTDELRNSLVAREIDLAFLMGPIAEVSVKNHTICSYEMIFAAAPALVNRHDFWSLQDISKYPVLTFASNTKPSRQIRELLSPATIGSPKMTTSTSLGAIVRLATSGMGICAIPKAVIANELKQGTLIRIPTDWELQSISFTSSYVSANPSCKLLQEIIGLANNFLRPNLIKKIYHI